MWLKADVVVLRYFLVTSWLCIRTDGRIRIKGSDEVGWQVMHWIKISSKYMK